MRPCDRPMAAPGLISYRCRNQFGWTMIGAKDARDAFREALRSCERSRHQDLQVWDGTQYVPLHLQSSARGGTITVSLRWAGHLRGR